jgi:sugar O-acyltransferase (sialic acid O-acetyltransferase NeuD family)
MKRVAFIGSGEMARHVAHYMTEDKQFEVVGYYDDFAPVGSIVNNYPVLGKLDDIETQFKNGVFDELSNAIGFTRMQYRREVFERFENKIPFAIFIHSSCIVDPSAKIGKGCVIFPKCILYLDAIVEDNVFIQINSYVTDSVVKKHTLISGTVSVAGRSIIGETCFIGVGSIISSDVEICNDVFTGAGTVVVKDITEPGTYVGVPARKIKSTM